MDSNLNDKSPPIIEIEDDVIDLDSEDEYEKTPEGVISEWNAKTRSKLSSAAIADNEDLLSSIMKDYLESLQNIVDMYENNKTLRSNVVCHIYFLYSCYIELPCCNSDNYLVNMENILTKYCNLELEIIRPLKKEDMSPREYKKQIMPACRRIIYMLTVYLLDKNEHMLHVLIKINSNNSDACSEVLNILYSHFLIKVPISNLSDESFCRYYILFQKWKEIRKPEEWQSMDTIMYKMFDRTPQSIENNKTLRQILMAVPETAGDVVLSLFRSSNDIANSYFQYIQEKKNVEIDDLDFNIDLGEDEVSTPQEESDDEDVTFLNAYYEVERSMSTLHQIPNDYEITTEIEPPVCKQEIEDDEEQSSDIDMMNFEPLVQGEQNLELDDVCRNVVETSVLPIIASCTSVDDTMEKSVTESNAIVEEELTPQTHQIEENVTEVPLPRLTGSSTSDMEETCSSSTDNPIQVLTETQRNHVYNDYGYETPPFVAADVQNTRNVESCVYTIIGQNNKRLTEKNDGNNDNDSYNDFGLTPPNDPPIEDHSRSDTTCLYTDNVSRKSVVETDEDDLESTSENKGPSDHENSDEIDENYQPEILPNTKKKPGEDCNCINNNQAVVCEPSETINLQIMVNSEFTHITKDSYNGFHPSPNDQIDTGQKLIEEPAPVAATFNGNTILKPSSRTNGQTNKTAIPKIMYTSQQKIKPTTLDEFSEFELQWNAKMKENCEFDDVLSGPVSRILPSNKHGLLNSDFDRIAQEKSRAKSPLEITSPPCEAMDDDFRNYINDCVNGQMPPPTVATPQEPRGIVKKNSSSSKQRVTFHQNNYTRLFYANSYEDSGSPEPRRPRSDCVFVPKAIRSDRRLNMRPHIVIRRLAFLEQRMKNALKNQMRIDYDKSTRHINEKDIVRCISPPKLSVKLDYSRVQQNSGSMAVKNREHLEKKLEKRKYGVMVNNAAEPPLAKKRAFRTSKKRSLEVEDEEVPRRRQSSSSTESTLVSKSDSEFDKLLLNSGAYCNKPFRYEKTS